MIKYFSELPKSSFVVNYGDFMAVNQRELLRVMEQADVPEDQFIITSIRNTAVAIVEDAAKVIADQKVLIWYDTPGIPLAREIHNKCLAKGADVKLFQREYGNDATLIKDLDEDGINRMFDEEEELIVWADNVLIVRNPDDPEAMSNVPPEKASMYFKRYGKVHKPRITDEVAWTLFLYPTEYEAKKQGMPYVDYFKLYMEACDQPWNEIEKAQRILKEKLDNARVLEFHANEDDIDPRKQTRLTMGIDGMTFCNSTIDKNYPGSEVFSAPELNTVNGQIYAEGVFLEDGYLMKNIYLKIENGKIVEAHAEEGNEGLQALLDRDIGEDGFGSRYFGECAIGTNGGLLQRFFNPLLNEKVGGSFHMAIGHCYELEEYAGDPVMVNNGNTEKKTSLHWDLTVIMHRQADGSGGGRIVIDGEEIQKDGFFHDEDLAILDPRFKE